MKILIVDDEKITREGIISSINWRSHGIENIYEADDGINGIKAARQYKPEIIISDIKMPRMNGVEMAKEIYNFLPDCSIIFLSGYTDKEYLKAAILLKVVNYVEKPINTKELEAAISKAVDIQLSLSKNRINIDINSKYTLSKLGLRLIHQNSKEELLLILNELNDIGLNIKPNNFFITILITLKTPISSLSESKNTEFLYILDEITSRNNIKYMVSIKNDEYFIIHFYSDSNISDRKVTSICNYLSSYLQKSYKYYIAAGDVICGIGNVYKSYNTAAILLQSSFFYEYNSIITSNKDCVASPDYTLIQTLLKRYRQCLNSLNRQDTTETIHTIYSSFLNNQQYLPKHVKDLYYKLFAELSQATVQLRLSTFYHSDTANILDYIVQDSNLVDLHRLLLDRINQFFSAIESRQTEEHPTIFAIKEYINKNYSNDNLSVKDISEYVNLSFSYICTLFKNETGKTINQYLTEVRIEKAKELLQTTMSNISEISTMVGYSDSNYFSKTFKKLVGKSPSEYKESSE
ncbi:MAG: response regulator [Clostridiales bacterium]|nr:response regulator [Clostridiales bacterium]